MISVSYSRYDLFRRCPKAFRYRVLDRIKTTQSPAMARGDAAHKALDAALKAMIAGRKPPMLKGVIAGTPPWDVRAVLPYLKNLVTTDRNPHGEEDLCFTKKWERCEPTDWDRCWLRVKVDLSFYNDKRTENVTIDYKTGKIKPEEHMEQLDLYALARMTAEPKLTWITAGLWYVDHEQTPRLPAVYAGGAKKHLKTLRTKWERNFASIERERKFEATPSRRACMFCDFAASRGGPCAEEARG